MQIADLVNAQPHDHLVILCGDFNIPRGSWLYDSLLNETGLIDPLAGDTRPTFRPYSGMGMHYSAPIDFTLYRAPSMLHVRAESDLRFTEKVEIGGRRTHISDHLGIGTHFEWVTPLK